MNTEEELNKQLIEQAYSQYMPSPDEYKDTGEDIGQSTTLFGPPKEKEVVPQYTDEMKEAALVELRAGVAGIAENVTAERLQTATALMTKSPASMALGLMRDLIDTSSSVPPEDPANVQKPETEAIQQETASKQQGYVKKLDDIIAIEEEISLMEPLGLVEKKGINTKYTTFKDYGTKYSGKERAAFRAQIQHESGGKVKSENANYTTASRISQIFSKARLQGKDPKTLVRNPKELLNTVYGGAWGKKNLGNTEPGDGYKYRGRGYLQITGRANYKKVGEKLGIDLENNPDLANEPETAMKIAEYLWESRVRSKVTDFSNTKAITKIINGGYNGLADRQRLYKEYMKKEA